MSILITFIKLLAVFDLLVIAAYFGRDILSTVWSKFRKKPRREEPFDFSLDAAAVPLSIDSIRQLYSGDAADFVEERLLPNAAQTMAVLTDREQTAARLLLSALVGFLAEEAPMDERSFPTPTLGMTQKNQPKIKYTIDFDVTPHQLRHTYITNLLYAGVNPKTVQYLAGHENSKTTMDIYAKVKYNKPEELFEVVNDALHQRGF